MKTSHEWLTHFRQNTLIKRMQFIYASISAYYQAENQFSIHNHK